jgi:hypothetical protein
MYPQRELIRLAAYKTALRWDIALRRTQCAEAAARVAQPLEWLDRMLAFWRRLSSFTPFAPLVTVLLGRVVTRAIFPRRKILRSLLRWGLLVLGIVRGIGSAVKIRGGPAPSANNEN